MVKTLVLLISILQSLAALAQTPKTYTSSEILLQIKKLNVLGSVLYIAAHPDDENTRLLAYLANEKLYRTGYLSLTRGDGGQNLIGDEQGIDLGLIRTQELLAARRIDGAEQFFSRAYDFGFCKTSQEALATWGHDKILSDAVWVIRKFKPDVIITRFPEDARAGHGHHAASAIIAREAFDAAADPNKFPEQLTNGVTVWQAKRILWNTFNFGNTNTTSDDQFKLDVGLYNPLLGKGYGEIAALGRSQHKSQGFGVAAQRGTAIEYFTTVKGEKPVNDLMDGVNTNWSRTSNPSTIRESIDSIINEFSSVDPGRSVRGLAQVYNAISYISDTYWKQQKQNEIEKLLEQCTGLFMDATTNTHYAVRGDSLKINFVVNNRLGTNIGGIKFQFPGNTYTFSGIKKNTNLTYSASIFIDNTANLTQPYWLENDMSKGSFNVTDQRLIGKAENDPFSVDFKVNIEGTDFVFTKPVRFRYTDPVKGEIYEPVYVVPQVTLNISPDLTVITPHETGDQYFTKRYSVFIDGDKLDTSVADYTELSKLQKGARYTTTAAFDIGTKKGSQTTSEFTVDDIKGRKYYDLREIDYDHIPSIKYFKEAKQKVLIADVKILGKTIGYIPGAGDKVPQALEQIGYKVTLLKESDITVANLAQFDAIVTGVRAYNINGWMNNVYDELMQYVKDGGVLVTQYNTSNQIGPVKAKISPYPFAISRSRVTDETAKVNFLLPNHPVLNYPNKITEKDFEGWIQERSIYDAEKIDSNYQRILSLKDAGEEEQEGSLIVANYGKGKFVYTGLVFFRELPAGVPGAYRLFANLIAPPAKFAPAKSGTLKNMTIKKNNKKDATK